MVALITQRSVVTRLLAAAPTTASRASKPPPFQSFRMEGHVITGKVTTSDGLPVYGAAIRIGKALLYSDRDGRFFARERKPGRYKVEVIPSEFIATGNFTVISAPEDATTKDQDARPNRPHPSLIAVAICTPHPPDKLTRVSPMFTSVVSRRARSERYLSQRNDTSRRTATGQHRSRWDLQGTGKCNSAD